MPSFLSLCLALLRLAIRTTNRVQGLLIDLHNTVEWVIEQQGDPLQIRSSGTQSTSLTLPPSADTVPSDQLESENSLAISTAEDNSSISMLESLRSQIFPSIREVPTISSTSEISQRVDAQLINPKNNSSESSHPSLPEDESKIKEIELTLKIFNKEPVIEPVVTVSSKTTYETHDSNDDSTTATSGIVHQSNEQSVVLQSISKSGTDAEESLILKSNEFKWREYRMMLKWYRDEPVVPESVLDGDGLVENELGPLDLSTNSENLGDAIDPEEAKNKPHSYLLPNLLETTKESEGASILPLSESTPNKVTPEMSIAPSTSQMTTSSTSKTDREVKGSIHKPSTSQASAESSKSKGDSKQKRKSPKLRSRHLSEEQSISNIRAPSDELDTNVALEVKALPESLETREPWLVAHKTSYDLDLKFERNLHLKEYDISTIREKGTSKITKSPISDSLTKNKHDIESKKKHSQSDRKKSGRTPVKSNESSASPSAVALPQTLSLPRFCVDSSTGNVQWKSDMPPGDLTSESKHRSPFKQSNKSPKKTNLGIGTVSEASVENLNIPAKKVESEKTTKESKSNSRSFPSETSTSEEEFQFKPTRERRPTPPPARFPEVETSTDSEKVDSKAKSLSFCTEPIKTSSVESEFKPTRERRPTPAARFPTSEFSANEGKKGNHLEQYEPFATLRRNESAAVEEMEFKSTRERKPTPAAKFVDHESTTSSDNESDKKSKLAISVPVEVLKLKEKSPLKSQQMKQSSPRRKNAVDRPEQFSPSRNQSIGIAEGAEFTFKPTRERRPTPAARFPTPESTDSETAGIKPTQPQTVLQSRNTETFTESEVEPNPTRERLPSSVPEITITQSPTRREEEVSVKSKLASRLIRKSSTSPRKPTSPTVRFQIPESQKKSENTGTIRKDSKLALRRTAKEMSTSEEEYDSKHSLSTKRKASPAKYPFFKSPRMLEDAAAAARSLNFSPHEMTIEKEVETQPPFQGNTFSDSVPILEKAKKIEDPHSDSSSSGSLQTVLLGRVYINDEGVLIHGSTSAERRPYEESHSTSFEGDSAPEGAACSGQRISIRAPHNSPINFKVTDEPSTEMSQSESTTGSSSSDPEEEEDSALEGDKCVSERPSAEDIRFLRQAGFRFESDSNSSDATETSIGYGSGGDSAPEGIGLFPQYVAESLNIAENVDTSRNNSASESACRAAPRDGSRRDSVPEGRVYIYTQSEPEDGKSLCQASSGKVDAKVGTDCYTISSNETSSSNMSEEDTSPEGTARLSSQLEAVESPSIAKSSGTSTSNNFVFDSATETGAGSCLLSENRSEAENVGINARLELNLLESSTVIVSSHASDEDSAPEGTTDPATSESVVNAEENTAELRAEIPFALTATASETSTGDDFSSGSLAFEKTSPQKSATESSSNSRAEKGSSLEAGSTSSESLKYEGTGGNSDPEGPETPFFQTSTKEFPTNSDYSNDTCPEIYFVSSNAKLNEISTTDVHGSEAAAEEVPNLYKLPEIGKSPNSDKESKNKLGEQDDSTPSESAKSERILKTSSGNSEPKEVSDLNSQPGKGLSTNVEDSDDTSSETDSTSSESTANEKSSVDGSEDDSATGGASNLFQEPETSKSPTNTDKESKDELNTGAHSSSGFTASNTSASKQFEEDFALEDTTDNSSWVESGKPSSRIANLTGTDSTFSDSSLSRTARNEGATDGSVPEESTGHNTQTETGDSSSANDMDDGRSEYNQAYAVELPSTDAESNSPERLSPIYEVSTNGTISDVNYSDAENEYSISSPSELSSEDEGEFIVEQDDSDNHTEFCVTPTNGHISSESEASFHQESGRNEYLHDVESSEEICEWPRNEKETSKISDSDTISSLSSPSKSGNSEEESEPAGVKIENTSEPNSETCNAPTLSISTEPENIDEDKNVKLQSVCLQENKCLTVTKCETAAVCLLVDTVQNITEGNILQEEISQIQILDTDFNSNSVAASPLSNFDDNTSCDLSVDSNITDKNKIPLVVKTQAFISESSTSMEIENEVVSKKESTTGLEDTLVSSKEMCSSVLAPRDTIALEVSASEMESSNIVSDSQVEVCSVQEDVAKHNEHASDATHLEVSLPESSICHDTNDDELVKCSEELISESFSKDVPLNVERAEIYDCSNSQSVACEVPHNADNTETDTYVASELLICKETSSGSITILSDHPDLERATSPPTRNIKLSPSIEEVGTENGSKRLQWFVGNKLIRLNSAKNDIAEVSTQPFINEATEESAQTNDSTSPLQSETLVDKLHKNADYSKATNSVLEASTVPDSSRQVLSIAQKGTSIDGEHINGVSIDTEYAEKFDCSSASPEALVCNISTCDDAELSSYSEILISSDLPILENVPKGEFELEIENADLQSKTSDLTCVALTETLDDSSEKHEPIIYQVSTDVHDITADRSDTRNNLKSESPVIYSTIARSEETRNNFCPEIFDSKSSLHIEISSRKDLSELKESNLPQLAISDTRSTNDPKISKNGDFVSISDSSVDCAEHGKSNDVTEFEVYIAPEPVIGDIAFGSTIEFLDSSLPETYYIEKMHDSLLLDTEFDSCKTPFTKHDSQNFETDFTSQSLNCDPSTSDILNEGSVAKSRVASIDSRESITADVVNESSISESRVASMDSGEPTGAEESTTNVQIDVLVSNVSETLVCEVSKNSRNESDNAVEESTTTTSSLEVAGSLDSAQGADEKMPDDGKEVEEDSGANVGNKAWKKKPRKTKKKRKH